MNSLNALALVFLMSGITIRCDDPAPVLSLTDSLIYYNNCSFSAKTFNKSCVLSACPSLSAPCSSSSSSTGCSSTTSTSLNTCLQSTGSICDVTVGHLPICPFQADLFGVAPSTSPYALTGRCVIKDGTGFIDGLNDATFCVTGSGPLTVSISAPNITSYASYVCTFTFLNTSITAPDFDLYLTLSFDASATVDLSTQPPTVNTKIAQSQISLLSFDYNGLPPILQTMLNNTVNYLFETMGTDMAAANFLATYAAYALQNTDKSCAGNK